MYGVLRYVGRRYGGTMYGAIGVDAAHVLPAGMWDITYGNGKGGVIGMEVGFMVGGILRVVVLRQDSLGQMKSVKVKM